MWRRRGIGLSWICAVSGGRGCREVGAGLSCACQEICSAFEIERRPRGASLRSGVPAPPAPTFVATSLCLSGHSCLPCRADSISRLAPQPPHALKPCTKAGNASLTGHGALQQMWEPATAGDAPCGRRSISRAPQMLRHAQRCAVRTALDLKGAANASACTAMRRAGGARSQEHREPPGGPMQRRPDSHSVFRTPSPVRFGLPYVSPVENPSHKPAIQ